MHYCAAKVQRNYNYYNGYFNECLQTMLMPSIQKSQNNKTAALALMALEESSSHSHLCILSKCELTISSVIVQLFLFCDN